MEVKLNADISYHLLTLIYNERVSLFSNINTMVHVLFFQILQIPRVANVSLFGLNKTKPSAKV